MLAMGTETQMAKWKKRTGRYGPGIVTYGGVRVTPPPGVSSGDFDRSIILKKIPSLDWVG